MFAPEDYKGPSEFCHLHNHTIFSALDGVASPEQYAEACAQRGWPAMAATEHGHMASVPDMFFAFKKRNIKSIAGCFLPNQPILTSGGVVAISKLVAGEMAISDKNIPRAISNIQVRDYDGDVVKIKAWGVEEIIVTPEHPFLVREVRREEFRRGCWRESIAVGMRSASDLKREKYWRTYATKRSEDRTNKRHYRFYLCVPRLRSLKNGYEAIDITNYTARLQNVPTIIGVDDELLWIMGLWLAEGTASYGKLSFWLCADEYHFYERIAEYFAGFGLTTSYSFRKDRDALDVCVYSVCFSDLFSAMFGTGFADKRIPWDMIDRLDRHQSSVLLNGLFDGDAKVCPDQSYLKLNNQSLVWQARLLLTRLGQYSAITPIRCNNSPNMSYTIRRRESGHFYYDYDNDYIYLPVASVEREHYVGKVYNMEVEIDNTYNVGVVVHNCEIYYNDYEQLRQEQVAQGIKLGTIKATDEMLYHRILRNRHLTILAKNDVGMSNLILLTTMAYSWGYYIKPRLWLKKIAKYKEGLIVLSGCLNGPAAFELRSDIESLIKDKQPMQRVPGRDKTAREYLLQMKEVFGDSFYIEVQMPCIPTLHDYRVFWRMIQFGDELGIKCLLTNDCHYLNSSDFYVQKVMMAIDQQTFVDDPNLFFTNSEEQYLKTRAELWATFKNGLYSSRVSDSTFETLCDNTLLVADQCKKLKPDTAPKIPDWSKVEQGSDADCRLIELTHKKLAERGLDKIDKRWPVDGRMVTYSDQVEIELERFISKGFASYFLITQDMINWGKEQGWPFGPRGCTTPYSLVDAVDGQRKIEDVQIGDKILDGFGDEQTVENKFIYDVSEELLVFDLDGTTETVTVDHKFYIIRDDVVMLLLASEIKDTDEFIGILQNQGANPTNEDNKTDLRL